jgi:hypothetical protein
MSLVHFWSPLNAPADLGSWDPDADPGRFPNGRGHAFYELYVRFLRAGIPVTIGPRPSREATAAVVFSKDMGGRSSLRAVVSLRRLPYLLILSDWPPQYRVPLRPRMTVRQFGVPRASIETVVPLLVQRGLLPRSPERFGSVTTLGYKGDPGQAPGFLRNDSFHRDLGAVGVTFNMADLQTPVARWHDFRDTDAVLCMRDASLPTDHKPPTKLVNAWAAGCIPLVGDEAAYRELTNRSGDAIRVVDAASVLAELGALTASADRVRTLEARCAMRRLEYDPSHVLQQWIDAVRALDREGPGQGHLVLPIPLAHWGTAQLTNHMPRLLRQWPRR